MLTENSESIHGPEISNSAPRGPWVEFRPSRWGDMKFTNCASLAVQDHSCLQKMVEMDFDLVLQSYFLQNKCVPKSYPINLIFFKWLMFSTS